MREDVTISNKHSATKIYGIKQKRNWGKKEKKIKESIRRNQEPNERMKAKNKKKSWKYQRKRQRLGLGESRGVCGHQLNPRHSHRVCSCENVLGRVPRQGAALRTPLHRPFSCWSGEHSSQRRILLQWTLCYMQTLHFDISLKQLFVFWMSLASTLEKKRI